MKIFLGLLMLLPFYCAMAQDSIDTTNVGEKYNQVYTIDLKKKSISNGNKNHLPFGVPFVIAGYADTSIKKIDLHISEIINKDTTLLDTFEWTEPPKIFREIKDGTQYFHLNVNTALKSNEEYEFKFEYAFKVDSIFREQNKILVKKVLIDKLTTIIDTLPTIVTQVIKDKKDAKTDTSKIGPTLSLMLEEPTQFFSNIMTIGTNSYDSSVPPIKYDSEMVAAATKGSNGTISLIKPIDDAIVTEIDNITNDFLHKKVKEYYLHVDSRTIKLDNSRGTTKLTVQKSKLIENLANHRKLLNALNRKHIEAKKLIEKLSRIDRDILRLVQSGQEAFTVASSNTSDNSKKAGNKAKDKKASKGDKQQTNVVANRAKPSISKEKLSRIYALYNLLNLDQNRDSITLSKIFSGAKLLVPNNAESRYIAPIDKIDFFNHKEYSKREVVLKANLSTLQELATEILTKEVLKSQNSQSKVLSQFQELVHSFEQHHELVLKLVSSSKKIDKLLNQLTDSYFDSLSVTYKNESPSNTIPSFRTRSEWYIVPSLGVSRWFFRESVDDMVVPTLGVHINFFSQNRQVPYSFFRPRNTKWHQTLSAYFAIPLSNPYQNDDKIESLFFNRGLETGLGLRLAGGGRIIAGCTWFRVPQKEGTNYNKLAVTSFVALSLDLELRKRLGEIAEFFNAPNAR